MRNEKILVVEFEENSLSSLLDLLQTEGFEVVTAKDGHEGLLKFESENPDLVILEPMLLKLHGFDLCRKISKDSPNKTPVIITTGFYKGEHYKSEAIETFGAAAFFEKPYKGEELLTTINDLLGNGTGETVSGMDGSIQEDDVKVKDVRESGKKIVESPKESQPIQVEAEQEKETVEKKARGVEVSREVDEMLKDALSEFGLSLDKKKPTVQKVRAEPEKEEGPKEDLIGKRLESLKLESIKEREEIGEEEEEEEEKELKTEEFIEELIRKEEQIEEAERLEEKEVLVEEENIEMSEEELEEDVLEEVREEAPDSSQQVFEDYFEQPEKKSLPLTLLGFLKKIKKSIPLMIGSTAFIILVAAGATYYFLKPNKASSFPKQEKSQMVSNIQRASSNPQEEEFASKESGNQDESEQGTLSGTTSSGGIEGANRERLASNKPLTGSEAQLESTSEFAAPTRLSSRKRQVLLPTASMTPESRQFEVIEVEDTKEARVELSELTVSAPQLEETAKRIIQPEDAGDRIKTGDLVPIESVDVLPVAVSKVNPKYPNSAFQRGIEATVEFRALISEFGNVLDIAFVDPGRSISLFHAACEEAVRQWKFSPAQKNGVNVKVWKTFSISFKKKNTE